MTSVAEVRNLSIEAAGTARTVRIRGVVSVVSGWKNSFFLQDGTTGISVDREDAEPAVAQGQIVELQGVTGAGKFAPVIKASKVKVVGTGQLPTPKPVSSTELSGGGQDSQWIRLTGLVRSAEIKPLWGQPRLILTVDIGDGTVIKARVHDFEQNSTSKLDGAVVTLRGVCGTVFNDRRQFVGFRLFVASTSDIKIEQAAPAEPFSIPEREFGTLLQFRDNTKFNQRVKVHGVVTWSRPGVGLYLSSNDEGVYVQTDSMAVLPIGASVEVIGYPAVGRYAPRLENALVRKINTANQARPKARRAAEIITNKDGFAAAPYDAALVTIKGRLVEEVPNGKDELLLMQDGDVFFTAKLTRSTLGHVHFEDDSQLQLTGVCVVATDQGHDAQTFSLFLRDKSDIIVIQNPPWWNARHATWVFSLSLLSIFAIFGIFAVRRQQDYLRELAVTDVLTGLYNRRGFLLLAEQLLQSIQRQKATLLLFYIDLDRFKEINDTFGHHEGDKALQSVTNLLLKTFRKSDVVGRLGGDEFSVATIVNSVAMRTSLEERLRSALKDLNTSAIRPYEIHLSIGAVSCDMNSPIAKIEDLLSNADAMMYQKKKESQKRPRYVPTTDALQA